MKAISYRHSWSSDKTEDEEKAEKFGKLLHEVDISEPYEIEEASLYHTGRNRYSLIEANGCSCWDGDYDGWEFTKQELLKWAEANKGQKYDHRQYATEQLADWVVKNIK